MGSCMDHRLLMPRRMGGFTPLSYGSDLALWLDPSYGIYTDRSTQLTAASSQYWSITHNSSLRFTTAMSVSFWVYRDTAAGDQAYIAKWTYSTDGGWAMQSTSGDATSMTVFLATSAGDVGGGCQMKFNANLGSGAWHHVAIVFDGTATGDANRLKLYLDGVEKTLTVMLGAVPSSLLADTADLNIGKFGGSITRYHNGRMDSVRIWGRALSAADVLLDYNSGAGKVYADLTTAEKVSLAASYEFDGDGLDAHGTNDLTAMNGPTYTTGIASGLAGDGDLVSLIVPRVGPNLVPPSYAGRPTWYANGGKPYISFDGVNDGLQTASNISLGAFTIATNAYLTGAGMIAEHGPGYTGGAGDRGSFLYSDNPELWANHAGGHSLRTWAGSLGDSTWRTIVQANGGTEATHILRLNGASQSLTGAGDPGTDAVSDILYLGSRQSTLHFLPGRIGDLCAINANLSAAQLAQLEPWLIARRSA